MVGMGSLNQEFQHGERHRFHPFSQRWTDGHERIYPPTGSSRGAGRDRTEPLGAHWKET